ncbi:MAG: hypothetical protein K5896_02800 [Prevotella sp.]|nr:hypothetical protein [Prevotella sp.]
MKKTIVSTNRLMILAMMMVMTISARSAMPLGSSKNAMSYNAAKNEALFLSDKGTTRLMSVLGWVPGLRAQPHRCTV